MNNGLKECQDAEYLKEGKNIFVKILADTIASKIVALNIIHLKTKYSTKKTFLV